jgi:hypothetical protein
MNWNEYKALALRTESVPPIALTTTEVQQLAWNNTNSIRILHATMGVCTELAELLDGDGVVNFLEECGDVLWYLAIADDVIGFYVDSTTYLDKPPIYWLGELNDAMKRHIFYGTELNIAKMQLAFNNLCIDLENTLNRKGFTLDQACRANIAKLEKRYPDKMFASNSAIHRDVDRELDHIALDGTILEAPKPTLLDIRPDVIRQGWAKLIDGVQIAEYSENHSVIKGRKELQELMLGYLCCTMEELHNAIPSCEEYDVSLYLTPETGLVMQLRHQSEEGAVDPFEDAQDIELINERRGQPTIAVSMDDLELPPHASLDAEQWASVVNANLSSAQLTAMAMGLCTDIAKHLRSEGANLEAKAYDALYVMMGSSNSLLADNSLFHMWDNLGYSIRKVDVLERLERWK